MDLGINDFLWNLFKQYWYWILLALLFKFLIDVVLPDLIKMKRYRSINGWNHGQDTLRELRQLSPTEFEQYVVSLFEHIGYVAEHNGKTGDHGIDVILTKDGVVTYVQCKKYAEKHKVGEPEVRNFLGSLMDRRVETNGLFITTGYFTIAAKKFAEDKPVELIDGLKLLEYIALADKGDSEKIKALVKACPVCKNGTLIEKKGRFGKFFGCSNYPTCKHTESFN